MKLKRLCKTRFFWSNYYYSCNYGSKSL